MNMGLRHQLNMVNIVAINSTMNVINDLTSDLYESLCDNDTATTLKTIKDLYKELSYVRKTIEEEREINLP